jgi:hypothetical protein
VDKADEQPVVDNARHPADRFGKPLRIINLAQVKVELRNRRFEMRRKPAFRPRFSSVSDARHPAGTVRRINRSAVTGSAR